MDQKPAIDTASLFASETFGQEGFHLVCFEVMNWGTFTSNIPYSFEFSKGESAILVGDNGSGKTTLIDAFLTLFVDNPTYNATSDTKKKGDDRRTLRTYFWGREDSDKDGRKKNLREAPSYSVILAQFTDHTGQTYTFARLLWMSSEADPKVNTLYVIANAPLRIQKDFYMDVKGINGLIRRLKMNGAIKTFDRYYEYIAEVRGNLHIPDDNALRLFNKIVSLKGIEDTDTFIRDNMLTEPQNDRCLNDIIRNADALEDISKAIETDEARIAALIPIADKTAEYDANEEKEKEIERQKEQARQWIYKTGTEDAQRLVQEKTRSKKENQEKEARLLDAIAEIRKRINEINSLEYKEAGQQIEQLKAQLEGDTRTHKDRYRKFLSYQQHCQRLSLEAPLTQEAFGPIPKTLEKKDKELKDKNEAILNQLIEENMKKQASDAELQSLQDTIRSMKTTNSNIDDRLTSIRDRLADSLHIPYREIPFMGELMEVKKSEKAWEGALERLLHPSSVQLLVPETYYHQTVSFMEKTQLHLKFTYLLVPSGELDQDVPTLEGKEGSVLHKLHIKEDSPFTGFLYRIIQKQYPHICCRQDEFEKLPFAITQAGQIKYNGRFHQKDDRFDIHDRRGYAMGFSNREKLQALMQEAQERQNELSRIQKVISSLHEQQRTIQTYQHSISALLEYRDFAEIDYQSIQKLIEETQKKIAELEKGSPILQKLRQERKQQMDKLKETEEEARRARSAADSADEAMKSYQGLAKRFMDALNPQNTLWEEDIRAFDAWIRDEKVKIPGNAHRVTANTVELWQVVFAEQFKQKANEIKTSQSDLERDLLNLMQVYRNTREFRPYITHLSVHIDCREAYVEDLKQIRENHLVALREKFNDQYKRELLSQFLTFKSQLEMENERIRSEVADLNSVLKSIPYDKQTYLQIECEATKNSIVQSFRRDLGECTKFNDAINGQGFQITDEQRNQVQTILHDLRGPNLYPENDDNARAHREAIERQKLCIDPRNWHRFSVSKRDIHTGEIQGVLYSSGAKSSGEGEKFAYIIMMACFANRFGLRNRALNNGSCLKFLIIDEAFTKFSEENCVDVLELMRQLGIQTLFITPLQKLSIFEHYVQSVILTQNPMKKASSAYQFSYEEFKQEGIKAVKTILEQKEEEY